MPEPVPDASDPTPRGVYTVSRLNLEARAAIEDTFGTVWVEGEISNLARPRSGHIYFSLKDERCQVRAAMFRMHNRRIDFEPVNGLQVLANVRVSLYPERGEFQLVVQFMEEAGAGALRRAFEALKQRLGEEGLFAAERKRDLPVLPRCIGVVTSPTGAALRDVLSVLRRRFAAIPVIIYPVPVQGAGAADRIAAMLDRASSDGHCDVLVLARGGGSLEDLWAFNEETLARAVHRATVPVVTGIGHEVDYTIADLVADRRAPTPSAAAEMVVPDAAEWRERVVVLDTRLRRRLHTTLARARERTDWLTRRVVHPNRRLFDLSQRLDGLGARLARATEGAMRLRAARLATRRQALERHAPAPRMREHHARLARARKALDHATRQIGEVRSARLAAVLRALAAVAPEATLERGYAIVTRAGDGAVLRDAAAVRPGETIEARLARGRVQAVVKGD